MPASRSGAGRFQACPWVASSASHQQKLPSRPFGSLDRLAALSKPLCEYRQVEAARPFRDPASTRLQMVEALAPRQRAHTRSGRHVPALVVVVIVSVPFCGEIEVGFARHDYMHFIMKRSDGEFVWRVQASLRRDGCPSANARGCGPNLNGRNQSEQRDLRIGPLKPLKRKIWQVQTGRVGAR